MTERLIYELNIDCVAAFGIRTCVLVRMSGQSQARLELGVR